MKYNLYATISMNGYIASNDGSEDAFIEDNWDEFQKIVFQHKNIIWGKNTYEKVLSWGKEYIEDFKNVKVFVLTTSTIENIFPNVIFCKDETELEKELLNSNIEIGLISGGTTLYTNFLNKDVIDKIILNFNSLIINNGIPLFKNILQDNNKYEIKRSHVLNTDIIQIELEKNSV